MPLELAGDGVTDRDLLGRAVLPLTGWIARLYHHDDRFVRLVLNPGGGSPLTYTMPRRPAPEHLVLGAHHVGLARAFGPAAIDTVTLAYGMAAEPPAAPVFLRRRTWRSPVVHEPEPVTLADRIWLAETAGHFDEVRVSADGHTAVRLV